STSSIYNRVMPCVMTLSVDGKDCSTAIGTAFLIASNGVAVTAFHVVNGARRVRARFHTGESAEVIGLIDADERRDLALIQVQISDSEWLKVSTKDPEVGSRAYVIGAPLGLEF